MKWWNVFQITCGCGGRPKEKIRWFAVEAVDIESARQQANLRVPAGSEIVIEQIV